MLGRAENIQTGTSSSAADLAADTTVAAQTSNVLIILVDHNVSPLLLFTLAGFAFLADDILANIADALALVRLGRADTADLGSELADLLLVDTGDAEMQSKMCIRDSYQLFLYAIYVYNYTFYLL